MSETARIGVAHLLDVFLPRTQTFVYRPLVHAVRTRPVVFARAFANRDEFPFQPVHVWAHPRPSPSWLLQRLGVRLLGRDPFLVWHRHLHGLRVLHAHFGPAGVEALAWADESGLPLVTSFYGFDATLLAGSEWRARYRPLFERGALFLAEGPALAARLVALGCPAEKVEIQRIGIDLRLLPHAVRGRRAGEPARILFAGRLVPKKGVLEALAAFAAVAAEFAETELRIAGEGPLREELERAIARSGLGGRVQLLGSLAYPLYVAELAGAHVLLLPSRTAPDGDAEGGAPTAILEAQATGLPVVSTRHADIPYVVREGESALLCDEGDAAGLAASLRELLAHPERWEAMGRAGRAHVEARHDAAQQTERLEALYLRLAAPVASPSR